MSPELPLRCVADSKAVIFDVDAKRKLRETELVKKMNNILIAIVEAQENCPAILI